MKSIFRNFLYILRRFASSSIINFLGLTGAIAVFIVCMIQAKYDYTYNRSFKHAEEIMIPYIVNHELGTNDSFISTPFAKELAELSAYIEEYTILTHFNFPFEWKDNVIEIELNKVKPDFINMFHPEVLYGDIDLGLEQGGHAVITESEAKRIFGRSNVVGEHIVPYEKESTYMKEPIYTIEAVIKDFPENSTIENGLYSYQEEFAASEWGFMGFFKIKPENIEALKEQISTNKFFGLGDNEVKNKSLEFISLKDYPQDKKFGNLKPRVISFTLVGVIVLVVAFINFINFSLVIAPSRVKSLNIHRVMGLSKRRQKWLMMTESALFTFTAFILSLFVVSALAVSDLSTMFTASLDFSKNLSFILGCGVSLILISLIVGYYPARYASSFEEIEALKGGTLSGVGSKTLREALLLFQLCTACVLPIFTAFVYLQYNYMVNYSWGLEKENILYFNNSLTNQNFNTLTDKLKENPSIIDFTSARFVPGNVHMGWGRNWKGKTVSLKSWPVYPNFLTFFGVDIVDGENFPPLEDGKHRIILNQKFVEQYADNVSPVGEAFPGFNQFMPICGIAENVNFESLHHDIEPMGFVTIDYQNKGIIYLKIAAGAPLKEVIPWIESIINKESDIPITVNFLDQKLNQLYLKEQNQAQLITVFSIIILIITMMGVYGLVSFNVKFREKEIALRKINGATEKQVVMMLNRNLLYIFGVAYIIAIPLSYWLSKKWIDQFAYRIDLYWWVYLLGGILVLGVSLLTISVKSHRAALKNPVESLKSE